MQRPTEAAFLVDTVQKDTRRHPASGEENSRGRQRNVNLFLLGGSRENLSLLARSKINLFSCPFDPPRRDGRATAAFS
jgi:hypothetical protein